MVAVWPDSERTARGVLQGRALCTQRTIVTSFTVNSGDVTGTTFVRSSS
jgi:hypothetical protein